MCLGKSISSVGLPSKSVLSWDASCLWKSVSTCICARGHIGRETWPGCPISHRLQSPASYLNFQISESGEFSSWTLVSVLKSPSSGQILNTSLQKSSHYYVFPREQFWIAHHFAAGRWGHGASWNHCSPLSLSIRRLTVLSLPGPVCGSVSTTQSGSKTARPILGPSSWWPWPSASITGRRWICRQKTPEIGSLDGKEAVASNSEVPN